MSEIQTSQRSQSVAQIAQRISMPLLLFSAVLVSVLLLSWYILLPRLTEVTIAGQQHDAQNLRLYHASVLSQVEEKESKRTALVLPLEDTAYTSLLHSKQDAFPFLSLQLELTKLAREFVPGQPDAVQIVSYRYQPGQREVEIVGDIRHVGPRSMTKLAEFTEALLELPFVATVSQPRFTRKESATVGPYSPFHFTISLR